ncbi:hypothetical protein GCM10022393_42300 [Aquimarina addita]|uniref:Sugar isomerase n=1 Tax=Aquimarina addita TaxID=870485 RepID=A0ABP6UUY3_9FLAO
MGIVLNQSIRNLIVTCIGFGIGAVNTLFLFTNFLDKEYYGLVSYLLSASNLIWPLMAFGVHNTVVKFYSSYTNSQEQNRFLTMMLVIPFCIALIVGTIGWVSYGYILDFFGKENEIIQSYAWTIFVLAITLSYFEIFFAWAKVKLKSVFGNIMKELFLRICTMILLCGVYLEILTVSQFVYAIVGVYCIRLFIMIVYALRLHEFVLSITLPTNYISILKYSSLIVIAGSVASLLIDMDKTMIERFLPIENVAKYGICAYIASVIIIPSRAMHQITYPLTAKLINEKKINELSILYKKSSLTLFTVSGLLFVLIICNVQELFMLIPDTYELFIWVVILIGCAKLFDNLLGTNNAILYSSDYYRIVLVIGMAMAFIAFVLNWICIPYFGVMGAAIATFVAVCCYNLSKLSIVQRKFGMHPFSKGTLLIFLLIVCFVMGFYFWDFSFHPLLNISIKSICISGGYLGLIIWFNVSPDITNIVTSLFKKSEIG